MLLQQRLSPLENNNNNGQNRVDKILRFFSSRQIVEITAYPTHPTDNVYAFFKYKRC